MSLPFTRPRHVPEAFRTVPGDGPAIGLGIVLDETKAAVR